MAFTNNVRKLIIRDQGWRCPPPLTFLYNLGILIDYKKFGLLVLALWDVLTSFVTPQKRSTWHYAIHSYIINVPNSRVQCDKCSLSIRGPLPSHSQPSQCLFSTQCFFLTRQQRVIHRPQSTEMLITWNLEHSY